MSQVKITSDGLPINTHVFVDGVELKSVLALDYFIGSEIEPDSDFHTRVNMPSSISKKCSCSTIVLINKGCQCSGN